jgi:hypothetical protein
MQLAGRHHVTTQCFHQRVQQLTAPTYPVRQSRSFQFYSLTGVDLALTVEREMVGILRNQNMRQQARTSQSARNRPARCRSLHDPFAAPTTQLGAHMADYLEAGRHVLQHLGNVFAELA